MDSLVTFVRFEVWIFVLGLMFIVGYQILTGKINAKEMLFDKENNNGTVSPGRVQLLMLTMISAIYYISKVVNNQNPEQLPAVPEELIWVLAGSNTVYLGGKARSILKMILGKKS